MIVNHFEKKFNALSIIAITATVGFIGINLVWLYYYNLVREESMQYVYVTTDLGTIGAQRTAYLPTIYEAENMVEDFMDKMFSHNAENYRSRIEKARGLINLQDWLAIYKRFKDEQVIEGYNRYNTGTNLAIDSVKVNIGTEPYQGVVYSRQTIKYQDQLIENPVAAKFEIIRVQRSPANKYGLQIINFSFIDYKINKKIE